ncbi:unnamed protein product [Spirodela intermedia]|uniref:WASH1 WAHD domain-containing protein n=1 Tax=Spirodela intermedia TaxID=51605 RepID=A0A7I8J410_SPIIN|nr:unnamed protein product [Spirodela intermedia]CAA6664774.1 unnamed protein product [Spirodela intermedia]
MLRVSEDGRRRREGFVATYRHLCASLTELQEAVDRIFDTISRRITEERDKLTEISERTQRAKNAISDLSSSKGPLIIGSPLQYPSPSENERGFRPLFEHRDGSPGLNLPVAKISVDGGLSREFGLDGTLELFKFFSEASITDVQRESHSQKPNPPAASCKSTHPSLERAPVGLGPSGYCSRALTSAPPPPRPTLRAAGMAEVFNRFRSSFLP